MVRSPWPAGALLLALTACAAPAAETPIAAEPAAVEVVIEQPPAPPPVVIETETEIVIEQPPAPPPVVIETETEIVIESAIAALTPPEPAAPATPQPAPEPEPDIDDDPEQLMGLAGGALAALLGEPGFRREDADAQVWQYRGSDCLLDVYLYRDGEETPHRVTYYEFRGGDGGGRPCLRDLLLARRG